MLSENFSDKNINLMNKQRKNFIEENKKLTGKIELYRKRIRIKKDYKKEILNRHLKRKLDDPLSLNKQEIKNEELANFELAKYEMQEILVAKDKSMQTIKTELIDKQEIENNQIDELLLEEKQEQIPKITEKQKLIEKELEEEKERNLNEKLSGIDKVYNDIGRHLSDLKEFFETGQISKRRKKLKELEQREEDNLFKEAFSSIFKSTVEPEDFRFFRKDEDEDDLLRLLDKNKPNDEIQVLFRRDYD